LIFWGKKIRNISIGWKYGLALGTTIALFLISASVILHEVLEVHANLKTLEEKSRHTEAISGLAAVFWAKDAPIADYVHTSNRRYIAEFDDWNERFDGLLAELRSALPSAEDQRRESTAEDSPSSPTKSASSPNMRPGPRPKSRASWTAFCANRARSSIPCPMAATRPGKASRRSNRPEPPSTRLIAPSRRWRIRSRRLRGI